MSSSHRSAGPPVLEVTSPDTQPARYDLISSPLIVGRLLESDIQLDSPRVSRRHASLSVDEDGNWVIHDLGSRNGTRVNDQLIEEPTPIGPNDSVEIGQFLLRLLSTTQAEKDEQPEGMTTIGASGDFNGTDFRTLSSSPAPRLNSAHLALVNALSQRLIEISESGERLIYLCRTLVSKQMRCNSAAVLRVTYANDGQKVETYSPFQLREGLGDVPAVSLAVVEAAVREQQPILAGGVVSSGLTVHFSEEERGTTAIIGCPLHAEPTFSDLLYATVPHHCGTVDWLALVALAAEQFKKAELQIEARQNTRANAALQNDLKKARKIQMALVPREPSAPGLEIAIGFEPCLWIGGDYANVMTALDGRTFLAVADVSGKGLPAAMVATGVHSIVHASIGGGMNLEELADRLNQFLLDSLDRQSFVTMLGVMFDTRNGRADCINAGHPPILIVGADGEVREMPFGHNPPLGVVPMTVALDFTELKPGELLVLYTDGLSELFDAGGKMLGVDGVESLVREIYRGKPELSLIEISNQLTMRLDEIRGATPATDDRTFLLARRRER